ncbi:MULTISPECIES: nuclear transport factor 2 family protein [Brevibacillus]|nr:MULTISPECIES: PhzA/PhzB family protein [Brevibacillus]MED1944152.1 PhzA/PhzB family protein [Brevibacillus formosus]MED1999476.1 PhzA/PhzB family protein [Brevibacillus formosus]MED2082387.1 PhzA/PhzB family protein [Brevibacillus formosus]PSK18703.1 hypothetical protein C7R94_07850 [Brevibacillus sp. NRRL NRS-603]
MKGQEVVRLFFEREGRQDVWGMGMLMANHIIYEMPYSLQADRVEGKEKLIQLLDQFIGKGNGLYSFWEISNIRIYEVNESCQELYFVEMDGKATVKESGLAYSQSYVSMLRVFNGEIVLWREYFNPIELQKVLDS